VSEQSVELGSERLEENEAPAPKRSKLRRQLRPFNLRTEYRTSETSTNDKVQTRNDETKTLLGVILTEVITIQGD
jgi:hypothetical protein